MRQAVEEMACPQSPPLPRRPKPVAGERSESVVIGWIGWELYRPAVGHDEGEEWELAEVVVSKMDRRMIQKRKRARQRKKEKSKCTDCRESEWVGRKRVEASAVGERGSLNASNLVWWGPIEVGARLPSLTVIGEV